MAKTPEKLYLGFTRKDFEPCSNERLYIEKHSWDCGWYWGFGYIGNSRSHMHFETLIDNTKYEPKEIFQNTEITIRDWWILRDLFVQAYALKKTAEVYRYGGHQTTCQYDTAVIQNHDKADAINADLKIVLDKIWEVLTEITLGKRIQPPKFNAVISEKNYVCKKCGTPKRGTTNHYGTFSGRCVKCSPHSRSTSLDDSFICTDLEPGRATKKNGKRCSRLQTPHKFHLCYQHKVT